MRTRAKTHAAYLECRTLGHAWDVIPAEHAGAHGGDPLWLRCVRCATVRQDSISYATGQLMSRAYVYLPGYSHAFDSDFADAAPTRSDFRRMLLAEYLNRKRGDLEAHRERKNTA